MYFLRKTADYFRSNFSSIQTLILRFGYLWCVCVFSVFFLNGNVSQKRESEFAKNLPWHRNGARLFSCDLAVEKASVVKTARERNLVKRRLF